MDKAVGAEIEQLPIRPFVVEIKRTTAPRVTPSIRNALSDLDLAEVIVVHAGRDSGPLGANVRAVAATRLDKDLGL